MVTVDWHTLAQKLGTLRDGGESGGSDLGRQALESIVGVDALRSAVDYYVAGDPGSELARSVLAFLKPPSAMERCLEIARGNADARSRRAAVELLRVVADGRGIDWAAEFLRDEDEGVQVWAAGIVDQLLWSGLADPDDCGQLLESMESHPNAEIQRQAAFVRSFLASRQKPAAVQIDEALRAAGWSEIQPLVRYRKGSWECIFDTSSWIEVGSSDNRRIFDVPVPPPHLVQWTVNLIEHLCATNDRVTELSATRDGK